MKENREKKKKKKKKQLSVAKSTKKTVTEFLERERGERLTRGELQIIFFIPK